MPASQNHTVRFGPFELDTQSAELRKSGIRLKLQGQPIQILEMLLAKPGELRPILDLRIFRPTDRAFAFRQGMVASYGKCAPTGAIFSQFWVGKDSPWEELRVQTAKFTFSVGGTARDLACGQRPTGCPGGSGVRRLRNH